MKHLPDRRPRDHEQSSGDDAGLETIEYALVAAIILGGLIALVPTFVPSVFAAYTQIVDTLTAAMGGG